MRLWAILVIFLFNFIGLYLFQSGFLLTKTAFNEIPKEFESSSIIWDRNWNSIKEFFDSSVSLNQTKVVLVLIDALRFDFCSKQLNSSEMFHNKLPVFDEFLNQEPYNSHLFHFIADPPTTTMQRLKALMTGSLPTFVDAGSNFATGRVPDDHLLRKLHQKQKKFVFMGDDTWIGLYEDYLFHAAFPYPSFEVFDLHTVDNGCLSHIWNYIRKHDDDSHKVDDDWTLLVSHFLGVDHVGHRYGPNHFEMEDKLTQLNAFLNDLFRSVDENTFVFVFGDHGMDSKGDHGGDSVMEVDAGLFVYSKGGLFDKNFYSPSFLNLPRDSSMNYSSMLGDRLQSKLIKLETSFKQTESLYYPSISQIDLVPTVSLLLGLDIPLGNLGFYLSSLFYRSKFNESTQGADVINLNYLQLLSYSLFNLKQIETFINSYSSITGDLKQARDLLNLNLMALKQDREFVSIQKSIVCYLKRKDFECFDNNWVSTAEITIIQLTQIAKSNLEACRDAWARFDIYPIVFGVFILMIVPTVMLLSLARDESVTLSVKAFVFLFVALHSMIFASNSFVIFEDWLVFYLIQSILFVLMFLRGFNVKNLPVAYGYAILLSLTRFTFTSTICREEQLPRCESTFEMITPVIPILDDYLSWVKTGVSYKGLAFLVLCTFLTTPVVKLLLRGMNLEQAVKNSYRKSLFMFRASLFFMWYLEYLEEEINQSLRNSNPYLILWFNASSKSFLDWVLKTKASIGKFNFALAFAVFLNGIFRSKDSKQQLFNLMFFLFLFNLGTQLPPSIWILSIGLIQLLLILRLSSSYLCHLDIILLNLFGFHLFFATGHQITFSSIQFQTGFIGLERFNFYLSGSLVTINSIGIFIVFNVATLYVIVSNNWNQFCLKSLILYSSSLLFSSCLFTGYHRRHLMVWNVFAPRFMFSAIQSILFFAILVIVRLITK